MITQVEILSPPPPTPLCVRACVASDITDKKPKTSWHKRSIYIYIKLYDNFLRKWPSELVEFRPGGERRGKRKRSTIFLERTREGHRESDEHWNRFKGTVGETSERWGGAYMGISERIDAILN